ncbi:sialidase family protein [Microbacterium sp. SS28]|uniref:WD40/YVTN/BNR-like repeat-containing protein n=1 Tax=Microbacterium sp. SS28 TaxID=2919948 RepID=UPI001FA9E2B8|nr:sialidase family protein [Microbacterium sp. SS28]
MSRKPTFVSALTVLGLSLAGCSEIAGPGPANTLGAESDAFVHIHGLEEGAGDALLVATHVGLYQIDSAGTVTGPISGNQADLMGLTSSDGTLFASGHPGTDTPVELGTPNLGIIRSDDAGQSWAPVAFTGVEDFHILDSTSNGRLFGVGSASPAVRVSTDGGLSWSTGADLPMVDLASAADGVLYAATERGVQVSRDEGVTFSILPDAPLLYTLDAFADGTLVGADTEGVLWRSSPDGGWEKLAETHGPLSALTAGESGAVLLADDRGIVRIDDTGETIITQDGEQDGHS